ncbi:MAG: DUF3667 domain-containing protein [Flavobacteriaceae bacterium]
MDCKNCFAEIAPEAQYCSACGAKVIRERITVKGLWGEFTNNVLGWDNKFFKTIYFLISKPATILGEYLNGTRKKYMSPISFFAIGMTLSILVLNSFEDTYLEMAKEAILESGKFMSENVGGVYASENYQKFNLEMNQKFQKHMLTYYNVYNFLMLPLYALIAFLVYGKPYKYGEHLVIITYCQGLGFLITGIAFLVGILMSSPSIFSFSLIIVVFLYLYIYGRLYRLGLGTSIVKFLLFVAILGIFFMAIIVLTIVITFLGHKLGLIDLTSFKM